MSKVLSDVMTVDVGWKSAMAFWTGTLRPVTKVFGLSSYRRKAVSMEERMDEVSGKFEAIVNAYRPKEVWIEGVRLYTSSSVSMAAGGRGDLQVLAYLAGDFRRVARSHGARASIIDPPKWKGQLPKGALPKRIARANGMEYPEHADSAVGIGLSLMGIL